MRIPPEGNMDEGHGIIYLIFQDKIFSGKKSRNGGFI
jgi:hypothetical protein